MAVCSVESLWLNTCIVINLFIISNRALFSKRAMAWIDLQQPIRIQHSAVKFIFHANVATFLIGSSGLIDLCLIN